MANSSPSSVSPSDENFIALSDSEEESDSTVDKSESSHSDINCIANDPNSCSSNDEGGDILTEVVQLIDWINSHNCSDNSSDKSGEGVSIQKKKFMNGFLFIEGIQTRFEGTQKVISEKDDKIAKILKEKENLKDQQIVHQKELEELRNKIEKLEEEKRQRKMNELSLTRLRSKTMRLQEFFGNVIMQFEQVPLNPLDLQFFLTRKGASIFTREIDESFNKLNYNLGSWDKNQKDIEEELESTEKVIERLNEMVMVKEPIRSVNTTSSTNSFPSSVSKQIHAVPVISTPTIYSPVGNTMTYATGKMNNTSTISLPSVSKEKHAVPVNSTSTPTSHSSVGNDMACTTTTRKRKMPPPALLPMTSFPSSKATPPVADSSSSFAEKQSENRLHYQTVSSTSKTLPTLPSSVTSIASEHSPSQQQSLPPLPPFVPSSKETIGKEAKNIQNQIPSTEHSPPLQLPVLHSNVRPQFMKVNVPTMHQREAIQVFGGPRPATSPVRPAGGQNVCGLCRMSFSTLTQLKHHYTVLHSKGPIITGLPAAPSHNSFSNFPGDFIHQQDRVVPAHHPTSYVNYGGPLSKRPCLGHQRNFSSSSPYPFGVRPTAFSSYRHTIPSGINTVASANFQCYKQ